MTPEVQSNIKVFICYAREDMAIAKRLYRDLRRPGIRPWMDTEDLHPGQQWKTERRAEPGGAMPTRSQFSDSGAPGSL